MLVRAVALDMSGETQSFDFESDELFVAVPLGDKKKRPGASRHVDYDGVRFERLKAD